MPCFVFASAPILRQYTDKDLVGLGATANFGMSRPSPLLFMLMKLVVVNLGLGHRDGVYHEVK